MDNKSVVVVFLDGVGLGDSDLEVNPFMHAKIPMLEARLGVSHLARDAAGTINGQAALLGLDATLGIPGLPQSGTGQTAILTGKNAPALLGEHLGPYPTSLLRELLARESLFKTLLDAGYPVAYANAYPDQFLDRVKRGKGRLSANTTAARLAGLKLRGREDLQRGRAINALLSNDFWPEPEVDLPAVTPFQAGENLAGLAEDYALTFFEFWYSDYLGHKQERERSVEVLGILDEFLSGILTRLDPRQSLLLVISDHGNFEDWTTKKHTANPALTLLFGAGFTPLVPQLKSLTDITPAVLFYLLGDTEI